MLKALKVIPDVSMDLTALNEAYMHTSVPGKLQSYITKHALILMCMKFIYQSW